LVVVEREPLKIGKLVKQFSRKGRKLISFEREELKIGELVKQSSRKGGKLVVVEIDSFDSKKVIFIRVEQVCEKLDVSLETRTGQSVSFLIPPTLLGSGRKRKHENSDSDDGRQYWEGHLLDGC